MKLTRSVTTVTTQCQLSWSLIWFGSKQLHGIQRRKALSINYCFFLCQEKNFRFQNLKFSTFFIPSLWSVENLWLRFRSAEIKIRQLVLLKIFIRCQFHQHFKCSFYARRSQKRQMTLLTWLSFFAHLGSTCVKAVHRTLMKLSPGVDFINILLKSFLYWSVLCCFSLVTV